MDSLQLKGLANNRSLAVKRISKTSAAVAEHEGTQCSYLKYYLHIFY